MWRNWQSGWWKIVSGIGWDGNNSPDVLNYVGKCVRKKMKCIAEISVTLRKPDFEIHQPGNSGNRVDVILDTWELRYMRINRSITVNGPHSTGKMCEAFTWNNFEYQIGHIFVTYLFRQVRTARLISTTVWETLVNTTVLVTIMSTASPAAVFQTGPGRPVPNPFRQYRCRWTWPACTFQMNRAVALVPYERLVILVEKKLRKGRGVAVDEGQCLSSLWGR